MSMEETTTASLNIIREQQPQSEATDTVIIDTLSPITGYWHCHWQLIHQHRLLTLSLLTSYPPAQATDTTIIDILSPNRGYWHCHYWHPIPHHKLLTVIINISAALARTLGQKKIFAVLKSPQSGLLSAIAAFMTWQTPFMKSPKSEWSCRSRG